MSFNVSINLSWFLQTEQLPLTTTSTSGNINVMVYPMWYKHIGLEWSVPSDWGNVRFDVYFSTNYEGPYKKINAEPIDGTFFLDTTTQEYSRINPGYYVVEVILVDTGTTIKSSPVTWSNKQRRWVELRSIDIQRREYFLLSHFVGIKSYMFRRKTYGKRCPLCWDYKNELVLNDNCPNCLGTSFEGGYFEGAPTYIQYDATPNDLVRTYFGKFEPNQINGWTISIPRANDGDIIVRTGDWNVYRVDQILPTELQGNTVRQIMKLTQLSRGEVEYKLVSKNLPEFPAKFNDPNYVF